MRSACSCARYSRGQLRDAALALVDGGPRAFYPVLLRLQVLLGILTLAAALRQHQLAGKTLARELGERLLLLHEHGQRAGQLGLRLLGGPHLTGERAQPTVRCSARLASCACTRARRCASTLRMHPRRLAGLGKGSGAPASSASMRRKLQPA